MTPPTNLHTPTNIKPQTEWLTYINNFCGNFTDPSFTHKRRTVPAPKLTQPDLDKLEAEGVNYKELNPWVPDEAKIMVAWTKVLDPDDGADAIVLLKKKLNPKIAHDAEVLKRLRKELVDSAPPGYYDRVGDEVKTDKVEGGDEERENEDGDNEDDDTEDDDDDNDDDDDEDDSEDDDNEDDDNEDDDNEDDDSEDDDSDDEQMAKRAAGGARPPPLSIKRDIPAAAKTPKVCTGGVSGECKRAIRTEAPGPFPMDATPTFPSRPGWSNGVPLFDEPLKRTVPAAATPSSPLMW